MPDINDIQPKKFKYTLDIRGVLTEVLFNSPQEWLETKIEYKRSKDYGGIMRSILLPLTFVFRGAGLLRAEKYKYGAFARVNLYVSQLVATTWLYKNIYFGKVDFSTWKDNPETGVNVTVTENNFSVNLKAYDDQQYAIPVDVPEAVDVELTPLTLTETADFLFTPNIDNRSDAFFEMKIITNQQNSVIASANEVGFYADSFPVWGTDSHWYYRAQVDTNVRHKGHFEGFIATSGAVGTQQFRIKVIDSNGVTKATLYDDSTSTAKAFSFDYDFTTSVLYGERLFFYFEHVGSDVSTYGFRLTNSTLNLEYNTISAASMCKALRCDYIFQQLVNKMNGGVVYPAVSYLLTNALRPLVMTCSDAIRQTSAVGTIYQAGDTLQINGRYFVLGGAITYNGILRPVNTFFNYALGVEEFTTLTGGFVKQVSQNISISISFKDFYQSIYSVMGGQAALGCETARVVLEDLTYFYRGGIGTIKFGSDIQVPEITDATDIMWNTIKVGYEDQQYDKFNGTKEVNSTQFYSTDLTTPKKELNLVSKVRADPYGIETVRITPVDTAASRSDNDNFFIWLKDEPEAGQTYYRPLRMEGLLSITGADESYYNWKITPKQNLLRGGAYLHSILDKMDGYKIKLTDSRKNISLVTVDLSGRRVAEGDDIEIGNLPDQLFIPVYMSFVPASPPNALDLLDSTPYADIWFDFYGVTWKGFIDELSIDAAENSPQTYKLLLSPDNNLLKLVH